MKQIHVWPNHVRLTAPDLVLMRSAEEPLSRTLEELVRLGFDTHPGNVEVHEGVRIH